MATEAGSIADAVDRERTDRDAAPRRPSKTSADAVAALAALATLDKLNRGVILIDDVGQVLFMNRAADAMLAQYTGITTRGGRLEFTAREATQRFEMFLERAADLDGGGSLVLTVAGVPQQGAVRVLVSPLEMPAPGAGTVYCVFIYEPGGGHRPLPTKVLAQLYELTAAESRLVNALFVGNSLQHAAPQVGVTVNTAKSVLRRVFVKCGVSTQAELLQLLALGPRTL